VACNRALVGAMQERIPAAIFAPSARLATDNAAMIARAGAFRLQHGERAGPELNAYATLPLPGLA
jgi:N6-L-threonylcarbamoyladenine synthase